MARRFKIPGDVVNRATADLPDDQRSSIRWLHAHAADNDLNLAEVGKLIRYDESTMHRVFNGKYEGNMANICREITAFKELYEERAKGRKLDFTETRLTRRIWKLCAAALEYQRICYIFGETQTGKTTALIHYRNSHNHGETIYVRMPTGGHMVHFLEAMAVALRMSPQQREKELRRRIIEAIDDRMLLIVDEAHQCLSGTGESGRALRPLEFIREIHDLTGCGVVICGTNVFRDEMDRGKHAGILKQCKRRRLIALQLSPTPTNEDLATFAAAYGLKPAEGEYLKLQTEVIREEALGMWLTLLRMGAKLAVKQNKTMTWDHVVRAHEGLRALEKAD